jgi:hypothetical protein
MVIFPDVYTNNGSARTCHPLTFALQIGSRLRQGTGQRVLDCASSRASTDSRAGRRPARRGAATVRQHRARSHRLTVRPGPRNDLLPPPLRASAPLLGSQPALRQPGPTVRAPRQSKEIGPHRPPWCRGRRNGRGTRDRTSARRSGSGPAPNRAGWCGLWLLTDAKSMGVLSDGATFFATISAARSSRSKIMAESGLYNPIRERRKADRWTPNSSKRSAS